MHEEEMHGPIRIQGAHHARIGDDLNRAKAGDDQEPSDGDRTENPADLIGAETLHGKERDQNHQADRHHILGQTGCGDLQSFHRAQDRNCRRDHAIAEEQRRAEDAEDTQAVGQRRSDGQAALHQRHQGQDAALALVVGAHDDHHVLHRDHQQQRPYDQRQDAEHVALVRRQAVVRPERFLQRVQRTGADIPEDHTQRTDHQRKHPLRSLPVILRHVVSRSGRRPDSKRASGASKLK